MIRLRGCVASVLMFASAGGGVAQTVADGSTSTRVGTAPSGAVTVLVAPADGDGTSLNRYSAFNVPPAGLTLDNSGEAARTIVNEVTGAGETAIRGQLDVLGQAAHVIIANKNGLVVDGGAFVNTGRVALTTGAIGAEIRQIAPGVTQSNVTATVVGGDIRIEGGGLAGKMDALDLIAHRIRVGGAVENAATGDGGAVGLIAGRAVTEFDSSIVPGNASAQWRSPSDTQTEQGAVLVEVTANGVLKGGGVSVAVTSAGAGMRYAGQGAATARNFVLSADGRIALDAAKIEAAQSLAIAGGDIAIRGGAVASGAMVVNAAGAAAFTDSALTARQSAQIDAGGALTVAGTEVTAAGHLLLSADAATISSTQDRSRLVAAGGAVAFTTRGAASNGDLINHGGLIQGAAGGEGVRNAAGTLADAGVALSVAGDLRNLNGDDLAIIFAAADDLRIDAKGAVVNDRGRLFSNADIRITAGGTIDNSLRRAGGEPAPTSRTYSRAGDSPWWTLGLKRERINGVSYDYGELEQPDRLPEITASKGVSLTAAALVNRGGGINANDGSIDIDVKTLETASVGAGKMTVERRCLLSCAYDAEGEVVFYGGGIKASQNARITAAQSVSNDGGVIYAGKALTIAAPSVATNAVQVPTPVQRPAGLYNFWRSKGAWVFLRDQYGALVADTDDLTVKTEAPVQVAGGSLSAGGAIDIPAGQEIVRAPQTSSPLGGGAIGLFSKLAP